LQVDSTIAHAAVTAAAGSGLDVFQGALEFLLDLRDVPLPY